MTGKAKPRSPKISAFSAHVITVRGDMTVEMSPFMKPLRVSRRAPPLETDLARLGVIGLRLRQDDPDFRVMGQIVKRRDDVPAVHLTLVDLLGAVIEAGGIAEPTVLAVAKSRKYGFGWITLLVSRSVILPRLPAPAG